MFINAIGTAVPPHRYSKAQCWEAFKSSDWFNRLSPRAHAVTELVLLQDNGIEYRHLAVDALDEVFAIDPDTLYQRFLLNAPRLAAQAGRRALEQARLDAAEIDAVIVSTCTGYLCPGLSGYVIEQLRMRPDVQAYDLVGQGCAAALPNLKMGEALIASGQCEQVLSICVEVCSAAMYLDDDPGVLISACLFGDGAGAAVLSKRPDAHRRKIEWRHSQSLIEPSQRDALRFETRNGLLRNILTRQVPKTAAGHAHNLLQSVLRRTEIDQADISGWILHAGGRDVLLAVQKDFGTMPDDFRYSAAILRDYGNLSSAFVYFVLKKAIDEEAPGGWWWLSSFGAGFSCHGALLQVE
ncbi:3-oxoacyl-[acyl-carrier-protein] synthase III C-terminal domain-containing protein [Oxalobacteraceae bacterium R-40]|uniref:3-oxoacyl-[acyl-carrier-protein] synthase III C-terminal domain-containing protein n=1 Tax=Keguizhuia sedimenti TaxID=3064264 RepID=A0ABU1BK99_9BURK|nr:3-oxoacyl-[acyl-carrier-protein] synthase III C-terminal domain-containing protein [Oxalobacteraceae bacterium R-40]